MTVINYFRKDPLATFLTALTLIIANTLVFGGLYTHGISWNMITPVAFLLFADVFLIYILVAFFYKREENVFRRPNRNDGSK